MAWVGWLDREETVGAPTTVHGTQTVSRGSIATQPSVPWVVLVGDGPVAMTLTGTRIGSVPDPHNGAVVVLASGGGAPLTSILFYASMAVLVVAWLGLGRWPSPVA